MGMEDKDFIQDTLLKDDDSPRNEVPIPEFHVLPDADILPIDEKEPEEIKQKTSIPIEMSRIIGPLYDIKEFGFIDSENINTKEELQIKTALYVELQTRAKTNKTRNLPSEETLTEQIVLMVNRLLKRGDKEPLSIPYPFTYTKNNGTKFSHYLLKSGTMLWEVIKRHNLLDDELSTFRCSIVDD